MTIPTATRVIDLAAVGDAIEDSRRLAAYAIFDVAFAVDDRHFAAHGEIGHDAHVASPVGDIDHAFDVVAINIEGVMALSPWLSAA